MSPRLLPIATAVMLYCSSAVVQAAPAALESLTLLDQAGGLPDDFRDHFFDVPLVVRVERDGQYLGDARAVLSRENSLSLLEFTDSHDSTEPAAERERWLKALATPRPLGACSQACDSGLVRVHYSLESSLLSIATENGGRAASEARHHALPVGGSRGSSCVTSSMPMRGKARRRPGDMRWTCRAASASGPWPATTSSTAAATERSRVAIQCRACTPNASLVTRSFAQAISCQISRA